MNNLKSKQIGQDIVFAGATQKTQQIYREKGSTIHIDEVEQIINSMQKVARNQKKNMNILRIYVVNGDKRSTWKDMDEFLEYYQGKVKDVDKFTEFYQLDITYAVSN